MSEPGTCHSGEEKREEREKQRTRMKGLETLEGFPGGSAVKNLPAIQETWVRSLGGEDPLEEAMITHSSILAWGIPWTEEPGLARVQTQLSDYQQQKKTLAGKVQQPHPPGPCHQHISVKPSLCLHIQSRLPASTLPA